jgi:hypothetical protein
VWTAQRNFEPMRKQVETWQKSELTDVTAKVVIYEAFVEGKLEAPKHLESLQRVHIGIQGTGPDSAVQDYGAAGRIPGSPVLTIVLAGGQLRTAAHSQRSGVARKIDCFREHFQKTVCGQLPVG